MPAKDELQEFLRERVAKSHPMGKIDWQAKKKDWIDAVERLYETIKDDILKDSVAEKLVQVRRRNKSLEERFIGKYTIPELAVRIGDEEVVFSPKGVNVIGAKGRVDLIGERGEVTMVLQPEERWSIVERRLSSTRLVPLTRASLLAALQDIMSR